MEEHEIHEAASALKAPDWIDLVREAAQAVTEPLKSASSMVSIIPVSQDCFEVSTLLLLLEEVNTDSMQVGLFPAADRIDVIPSDLEGLDVERLANVSKKLRILLGYRQCLQIVKQRAYVVDEHECLLTLSERLARVCHSLCIVSDRSHCLSNEFI